MVRVFANGSGDLGLILGAIAMEKGAFGSPSTKVTNFTYNFTYLKLFNCVQTNDQF